MNCMNCGAAVNKEAICPVCGFDVQVQRRAIQLSNQFYNRGLDKAEIRDMSGAIDLLKRSLKFNKMNIPARNLLGLIYFETGEVVAALSEWVISKNLMQENNIASEYINRLQAEANKLDAISETIRKYNTALKCCRDGNEDVAAIQMKKVLVENPKLIKGYHLLALIYIHGGHYEKARKILKRAVKIDKTNSTTLRFLKEVDEQTGTVTNLEGRWNFWPRGREKQEGDVKVEYISGNETIISPPAFRETSMAATFINIGLGLFVGICVTWFLVMPANRQKINREANEKVVEYSNAMASQLVTLEQLKQETEKSQEIVSSAKEQISTAEAKVQSYENLTKAMQAYQEENYDNTVNALENIEREQLSLEAQNMYDTLYSSMEARIYDGLVKDGAAAFYRKDYAATIELMQKAKKIKQGEYQVLNLLAHAYRNEARYEEAKAAFEEILVFFPTGKRADSARAYLAKIETEMSEGTDTGEGAAEGGDIQGDAEASVTPPQAAGH